MANLFAVQTLLDGPRNVVVKVTGVLDTSDLASTTVIDPSTLSAIGAFGTLPTKVRIDMIEYNIEDTLSVNLFWDATTPVLIGEFVGRGTQKYRQFGGLLNNAGAGITGKITATTTTTGTAISATNILSFTLFITLVKQ
jgi:hypothetical protein